MVPLVQIQLIRIHANVKQDLVEMIVKQMLKFIKKLIILLRLNHSMNLNIASYFFVTTIIVQLLLLLTNNK